MDGEAYFEAAASLGDHCSREASPKHAVPIQSGKELNHGCEAEDPSRDIETDLIDERFRTLMTPEHIPNQERQRLVVRRKNSYESLRMKRNESIIKKLTEDIPYQSVSDVLAKVTM